MIDKSKKDEKPEWAIAKISANHNFFIRAVIVAVVSQILVGVISAFLIFGSFILFSSLATKDVNYASSAKSVSVQPTNSSSTIATNNASKTNLGGFVITTIIVVSCNGVYFIYNLWNITAINKKVSEIEDDILKI